MFVNVTTKNFYMGGDGERKGVNIKFRRNKKME